MRFFKKVFGQKEEKEEIQEEIPETVNSSENTERKYIDRTCQLCGNKIAKEKWKKVRGELLHKKCYKIQERKIWNGQ